LALLTVAWRVTLAAVSIVAPLPFSSRAGGEGNRVTGDEPGSKRKSETLVPIGFWETLQLRLQTIDQ
jgi:hypothetical protein